MEGAFNTKISAFVSIILVCLKSKNTVPQIECPKMLYLEEVRREVIIFNLKFARKQEFRFPLKVACPKGHKFTCEVEIIEDQSEEDMFTFKVQQSMIGLSDTNGASQTFSLVARATEKFDELGIAGMRDFRKVMIIKIANSSLIFSFPMLFRYVKP